MDLEIIQLRKNDSCFPTIIIHQEGSGDCSESLLKPGPICGSTVRTETLSMRYELTKGREEEGEAPGSHMINM